MSDSSSNDSPLKKRFYRDGAPYYKEYELVLSHLFGKTSARHQAIVDILVELIQNIQHQIDECHDLLGAMEHLVEEARAQGGSEEEIEKRVEICRKLQSLETHLGQSIQTSTNKIVDELLPR